MIIRFLFATGPKGPVAQPRQRHTRSGHNYIPRDHPIHDYRDLMARAARNAYRGLPLEGPIGLAMKFVFPRPKSKTKKGQANERYLHTKRPDIDNCVKPIDCLKGILWLDDSQIATLIAEKWVAAEGEEPFVELVIKPLDPQK